MKNEEILKAAQEKQNQNEEYEKETFLKGTDLTFIISSVLGIALIIAQYALKQTFNYGVVSLMFAVNATIYSYRGIKLHKRVALAFGVFCIIFAVFFLFLFFGELVIA